MSEFDENTEGEGGQAPPPPEGGPTGAPVEGTLEDAVDEAFAESTVDWAALAAERTGDLQRLQEPRRGGRCGVVKQVLGPRGRGAVGSLPPMRKHSRRGLSTNRTAVRAWLAPRHSAVVLCDFPGSSG